MPSVIASIGKQSNEIAERRSSHQKKFGKGQSGSSAKKARGRHGAVAGVGAAEQDDLEEDEEELTREQLFDRIDECQEHLSALDQEKREKEEELANWRVRLFAMSMRIFADTVTDAETPTYEHEEFKCTLKA